ncbi:hypothetical protein SAMN05877838_2704 [Hoeflea halophila]|uniref:Uncharacterized protein n=1 Tax=Hoeflea halophila TaxID=714899 RepID=A0A286ICG6_9HYPH|nr:hypothetical protein [Hoeflea halophila]SOE17800.1 hypothetical protein SAMN05877838_2704 [Hoeflea halophila]
MSKYPENLVLYATTGIIFAVGVGTYSALAPIADLLESADTGLSSIDRSLATIAMAISPVDKNRSPYQNRLKDGCYQVFGPAILDRPGCYTVQEDITFEKDTEYLVYIKASDVTVDLNGKTVSGTGQSSVQSGIYIESGDNVKIKNGTVKGFMFGIRGEEGIDGEPLGSVIVENVRVADASLIGIKVVSSKVSLRGTVVTSSDGPEPKKYDYLFDYLIEADECHLKPAGNAPLLDAATPDPRVRLPADCVIDG